MALIFSDYIFIACITCCILTTCYYLCKRIKQDQSWLQDLTSNNRVLPVQTIAEEVQSVTEEVQIIECNIVQSYPCVPPLPKNNGFASP